MRHVVHKEVMDTLQDIKEILDITNTHTLLFLSKKVLKQKEKNTRKITVFMHLHAQKHPISWEHLQKDTVNTSNDD
jgi:hypothetical protein